MSGGVKVSPGQEAEGRIALWTAGACLSGALAWAEQRVVMGVQGDTLTACLLLSPCILGVSVDPRRRV